MKNVLACIVGLSGAIGVGGCSSGEDVYIETGTAKSELCKLSPGEDVCARSWSEVPVDTRAEVVTWLDAVSRFAAETRAMLDQVDAACTEMAGNLVLALPAITEARTTSTAARCKAVTNEIHARKTAPMTVETVTPSSCTTLAAPLCVLPGSAPRRECTLPEVRLEPESSAAQTDQDLAAAIQGGFARLMLTSKRVGELVEVSEPIANAPMRDGILDIPDCLRTTAIPLVTEASSEARSATEITADLMNAIGTP